MQGAMDERDSPPVVRPGTNAPYHPASDPATYRDLLLFEERFKRNAEMLTKRSRRYSIFLWTFVGALLFMAHRLLINPPTTYILLRLLQGSLAVDTITLCLFFASGMYEEKIRYAKSYVIHSNKALRPLNMHLNMRQARPTITSILSYLQPLLPFSSHLDCDGSAAASSSSSGTTLRSTKSMLTDGIGKGRSSGLKGGMEARRPSATIMAQIPPTSNPRGELIFSGRVDRTFREGYERYRAAFERRRVEKEREHNREKWGRLGAWWNGPPAPAPAPPPPPSGRQAPRSAGTEGRASPTPPASRRSTPDPSFAAGHETEGAGAGLAPMRTTRSGSPTSGLRERQDVHPQT